jgi:ubiquinone biosynthesis protein UbiJ
MSPIVADLFDHALRAAVSRAQAESPRARVLLAGLEGRPVTIEVRGTPWTVTVLSTGAALRIERPGPAPALCRISGTPLALLALGRADADALARRSDVRVEGDPEVARDFGQLALLLRPDLEQALSQLLGRSGAHIVMRGLRAAAAWTRATAWSSVQNVSEYLAHERGDLVSRAEAEHLLRGVDEARDHLGRLDARMARLERGSPVESAAGGREPA